LASSFDVLPYAHVAHLTLLLDNREVRKFVLNRGVTTIGRAQDNDIVINNLALSRRHAQIEFKSGRYEVVDLQSQNGVFVNSERIRDGRELGDRDAITLGTYQFIFRTGEESEPQIRAAPPRPKPKSPVREETEPEAEAPPEEPAEDVPLLVLKYNDVELQRFPLRNDVCLIGRAKECDVQIAERRLSRKHCEIDRVRDRWVLRDLDSQNGTYVNRRKIRGPHELKQGDVLNFAEYAVLFVEDGSSYQSPDAPSAGHVPARSSDPSLEKAETMLPPAYNERDAMLDEPIRPTDLTDEDDGRPAPPMNASPKGARREDMPLTRSPGEVRAKRKGQIRAIREKQREEPPAPVRSEPAKRPSEPMRVDPIASPPKARLDPKVVRRGPQREEDYGDVPDDEADLPRDEGLQDWYQQRREKSEISYDEESQAEDPDDGTGDEVPIGEEDSLLLKRGRSSISQVLSTMMVDKRELDKNLRGPKAKQRRFFVEVRHHERVIYAGPLTQPVTILGTDREADIKLRGRFVAGRHSLLVRVRDSLLLVRLGSSSAARVNGLPKLQAFLKTGDVVQIDETVIKISED
jgi:pSer/pThr/pTyr-binding forkhead associated (FHA) protein